MVSLLTWEMDAFESTLQTYGVNANVDDVARTAASVSRKDDVSNMLLTR